jgi:hypothetical protein
MGGAATSAWKAEAIPRSRGAKAHEMGLRSRGAPAYVGRGSWPAASFALIPHFALRISHWAGAVLCDLCVLGGEGRCPSPIVRRNSALYVSRISEM